MKKALKCVFVLLLIGIIMFLFSQLPEDAFPDWVAPLWSWNQQVVEWLAEMWDTVRQTVVDRMS